MNLKFQFDDGGRSKYFKATTVDDCVTRALAIAAQRDYKEVYSLIKQATGRTPRNGGAKADVRKVCALLGGEWVSCMRIGQGCKVHLAAGEIPMKGRIACTLSGHLCAVVDGIIHDNYDPSRDGKRCVYGYWVFNSKSDQP